MDINKILNSDYLDIIFEGRNKKYGGYELRKKYPNRMRNSALAVVGVVGLLIGGSFVVKAINDNANKKSVAIMKEVTLAEPPPIDPKKPPPPPPPEPPPPVKPTVKFTPPVIKKDEEVKEDEKPPEVKELEDKSAGLKTVEGDPNGIDPGIVDNPGTGVVAAPAAPEIFKFVEQMPEAGYDPNAFVYKNIVYPAAAKENDIQGRVTVQFVVNEDGSISGARVVGKKFGGGLEEEAVRVVSKMPPWKPGKQNGRPVKVYYTLPISFKLE
jgi:TonB family C-terminal domain